MKYAAVVATVLSAAALLLFYNHPATSEGYWEGNIYCFYYDGVPPVLPTSYMNIRAAIYVDGKRGVLDHIPATKVSENGTIVYSSGYYEYVDGTRAVGGEAPANIGFIAEESLEVYILQPVVIAYSDYTWNRILMPDGRIVSAYVKGEICLPYDALVFFSPGIDVWRGGG